MRTDGKDAGCALVSTNSREWFIREGHKSDDVRYRVTFRSGEESQNLECVIYRDFSESEGEKELPITTKKARAIMENAHKIREELGGSQLSLVRIEEVPQD